MDLESGKVTLAQVAMLSPAASRFPLSTSSREPFPCSRFVGRFRLACVARLSNGAWKNFLGKRRRRHIFPRCSICRSTSTFSAFEHQQTTPPAPHRGRPSGSGASSAKANHVYYNELRSETHRSMPYSCPLGRTYSRQGPVVSELD